MRRIIVISLVLLVAAALALTDTSVRGLWPPAAALLVILATRSALTGLLAGGVAGALILAGGNPWVTLVSVPVDHFWPSLQSPWKQGAIVFTLSLGGFAAVLEAGGGFTRIVRRFAGSAADRDRRLEAAAAGLGVLCFFDGLANSMVVGRVGRDLADRNGVARVKLAYIADSTSSAVACVAVVSTWIAFQLSLISEAFALAGSPANPYLVFLRSLPYNFYCWFTLVLLMVAIGRRYHPGPMGRFVAEARKQTPDATVVLPTSREEGSVASALAPLGVLMAAFLGGFVVLGSPRPILPLSRDKVVAAFGSDAGPLVLVLASVVASLVAVTLFPRRPGAGVAVALRAFARGVTTMGGPILVLLAAWIMSSVLGELGTARMIAGLATETNALFLLPTMVFLTGAIVSFATGTSWGTMGILFPLAVPAAAAMGAEIEFLHIIVAAVFSGAVFGDHCSPFSDTTIVTSISCGVEPHDHVRTQIPYALITAAVAVLFGFLPAGLGWSGWVSLLLGAGVLLGLPRLSRTL